MRMSRWIVDDELRKLLGGLRDAARSGELRDAREAVSQGPHPDDAALESLIRGDSEAELRVHVVLCAACALRLAELRVERRGSARVFTLNVARFENRYELAAIDPVPTVRSGDAWKLSLEVAHRPDVLAAISALRIVARVNGELFVLTTIAVPEEAATSGDWSPGDIHAASFPEDTAGRDAELWAIGIARPDVGAEERARLSTYVLLVDPEPEGVDPLSVLPTGWDERAPHLSVHLV